MRIGGAACSWEPRPSAEGSRWRSRCNAAVAALRRRVEAVDRREGGGGGPGFCPLCAVAARPPRERHQGGDRKQPDEQVSARGHGAYGALSIMRANALPLENVHLTGTWRYDIGVVVSFRPPAS